MNNASGSSGLKDEMPHCCAQCGSVGRQPHEVAQICRLRPFTVLPAPTPHPRPLVP
ncbi:rCG43628 [Rattus norvegicus]|uniref:RCG43628 n=1 Tax=Rattus norvegicus TaxID=10116 RepID=A6JJ82_RAT|nr:rCG43628 [Rattus norvegicus]